MLVFGVIVVLWWVVHFVIKSLDYTPAPYDTKVIDDYWGAFATDIEDEYVRGTTDGEGR